MAADVSSYVRHRDEPGGNSEILITKDLLGEFSKVSNSESDRALKPEQVYHERCNSPNSPLLSISSSENKKDQIQHQDTEPDANFQDLNYPPSSTPQINLFPEETETCLDLKLQSSSSYQSVCTLDKVKSALQRAEKKTTNAKKRPSPIKSFSSTIPPSFGSNNPNPSSSGAGAGAGAAMFAAGCPGCLLYVMTLKTNPKCPRCNSTVPSPLAMKKAKIDLNSSV